MTKEKTNRPKPPPELEGEALLEWERICEELAAAGKLESVDRAIITVYVQAWSVHHEMTRLVTEHGAIIKHANGVVGQSPFYKVQRETAAQLRGLLNDLGLTPASRGKGVAVEASELEI